jgi:hypothetical protein
MWEINARSFVFLSLQPIAVVFLGVTTHWGCISWRYNPLCLYFLALQPTVVVFPVATTHCGWIFTAQERVLASSFSRFLDHTQRRATVGRIPLDEWLIRRRDLYVTTHNTHNRQTSMPPVGFEPTISVGERTQEVRTENKLANKLY